MQKENVEAMVRDEFLRGRVIERLRTEIGEIPQFGLQRGVVVFGDRRSNQRNGSRITCKNEQRVESPACLSQG